jgi:hypothetical protein
MPERRSALRYACVLEASWQEGKHVRYRPGWPARVMNISTGGVALHSGEFFPAGVVLTIGLHSRTITLAPRKVKVIHCGSHSNNTWLIGTNFLEPLTEQDLAELLK